MWDDIVIGEGNKYNTAFKLREIKDGPYISHNRVSYWITKAFLEMGMTIFKNTPEGEKLTKLLESEEDAPIILYLAELTLIRAKPETILSHIANMKEDAFEDGRRYQARAVRRALML